MSVAVRSMFEEIAPTYDAINTTLSFGIDGWWRRQQVNALGSLEGARVLDLCAGTLDLTALVARRFPSSQISAVDFAPAMLARGVAKLSDVHANVEIVVGDALDLPFADEAFDAAACAFGVRNLDDPAAGLREARRVLVPGGRFAVLEFFRPKGQRGRFFHDVYNRNVLPAIGGLLSGNRAAYGYLAASIERFLAREDYEHMALDAGFRVVSARSLVPAVASLVVLEAVES